MVTPHAQLAKTTLDAPRASPPVTPHWFSLRSPAFPFIAFFAGFPMWWAMGFGTLGFLIMSVPLAYHLLRRRSISVPPGFVLWLLFLGVVLIGVVVLWTPIPGLLDESGVGRLMPWAYRVIWFAAITTVLLFIGNTPESVLPRKRIILLMAWMFTITVAGGYAGQFLWNFEFPSLLEVVLPRSLTTNGFFASLIHPGLAQLQDILGYPDPRPKAPFDYANSWGANFGVLLPFYLMAWRYTRNTVQRFAYVALLVAAVPPVIFSLNRGLWAGLAVLALVGLFRLASNGRWLTVVSVAGSAIVLAALFAATPLWTTVEARLANPHSNEGRSNLAGITVETAMQHSPVIGFGSTRQRQGNFFSIASGATADCHQCSPPQLGTQGYLWYLIFCTGILGTVLFAAFIIRRTLPVVRRQSTWASGLLYTVVFFICVLPVYDVGSSTSMFLMIALALIWRFEAEQQENRWPKKMKDAIYA